MGEISSKLSVIVPSLLCKYASKTVEDLFAKSRGDIEIIVMLDNYWPDPPIKDDKRLVIVHRGEQLGMRSSINDAVRIAKGKYIMKCDDHTMFGEGFDEILKADCGEDEVAVPSKYGLDPVEWKTRRNDPEEYRHLTYPYAPDDIYPMGLHGKKWIKDETTMRPDSFYGRERDRKNIKIDGIIASQGSCWFCHKDTFLKFGGLDEVRSYLIYQEPQEMAFKFWLSGGRMIVNKNTWYAHWHKGQSDRIWRRASKTAEKDTKRFHTWYWMNDQWPQATRTMKWLLEQFLPMSGWPENWEEEKEKYEKAHPEVYSNFTIFDKDGNDGMPIKGL